MRFQAYFTPIIKILLYVMAVVSLIGTIVGILVLARVPIELTTGQATLLVSFCPLCTIITLMLATIHYKVTATHLRLYIGFIDILGGKISLDKILNIVIKDNTMYLSYLNEGTDPIIAAVMISPKRYAEFKDLLMTRNPRIIFHDEKDDPDNSKQ